MSAASGAAPLDVLLSATPAVDGARGQVELGLSVVNRRIDFSDPEDDSATAARAARGDYRDGALAVLWLPADRWQLSGGLARRFVSDGVDHYRYDAWQLAAQFRVLDGGRSRPALALRLGAWGQRAAETATTTPVRVPGAILDTVTVTGPRDRTLQIDAVATWTESPALQWSLLAGAGRTQLAYDDLTATTRRNGCQYDLQFNGNDIFGSLAAPCDAAAVIEQFYDSSGEYGVDVAREIAWSGRFVQLGANLRWQRGDWTLRAGWLWHRIDRDGVDAILAARGRPVFRINRTLVLEGAWRLSARLDLFARAQVSDHLFFNDLPVTYNSSTSGTFGSRLSLLTLGLRSAF